MGRELATSLWDHVELSVGILDTVGVTESILEKLYYGSWIGEIHGVVFQGWGDLVESLVLQAVN